MNTRLSIAMIAMAALSLIAPGNVRCASADATAVAFLKPMVQWAQQQSSSSGTYGLNLAYVSNQPNLIVGYAEGQIGSPAFLPFYDVSYRTRFGLWVHNQGFATQTNDDARAYFSDRRWSFPYTFDSYPFNEAATDNTAISLDSLKGQVTLTLDSWGGSQLTADLHAMNGVLVGTLAGTQTSVLISVQEHYLPPPPR